MSNELIYSEAQLIHFGNFLFKRYDVMVFSSDGKNQPIYERGVTDSDLCNWKELDRPLQESVNLSYGDKVKVFLMPEGEDTFPGLNGSIVAIHDYPGKKKYDVEITFAGGFKSRVYNVDEILIVKQKK